MIREMADALALELVEKGLATDQLILTVGYDIENIQDPARISRYQGEIKKDRYGRSVPKHSHGTENYREIHVIHEKDSERRTCAFQQDRGPGTADPLAQYHSQPCAAGAGSAGADAYEQMDLFVDYETMQEEKR